MHPIVEKERELSEYLEEWISARYKDWSMFYHSANQDKRNGVYRLKSGDRLMDLLDDIMGNIEEHFDLEKGCHLKARNEKKTCRKPQGAVAEDIRE